MTKLIMSLLVLTTFFSQALSGNYTQNNNRMSIKWQNNGVPVDGSGTNDGVGWLYSAGFAVSAYMGGSEWADLRTAWQAPASRFVDFVAGPQGRSNASSPIWVVDKNDSFGSKAYIDWADAVALGAEYLDVDKDGSYDPNIDEPNKLGKQTAFMVINDGKSLADRSFKTDRMNLEVHVTTWSYERDDEMGDIVYMKYKFINKDTETMNNLLFSLWTDLDLGANYQDDMVGCDTVFAVNASDVTDNLAYYMNFNAGDGSATGFDFMQGPVIPGDASDVAYNRFGPLLGVDTIPGSKNGIMISAKTYDNSTTNDGSPGGASDPIKASRWYQEGGFDREGTPTNPALYGTGGTASDDPKFMYSGDPVAGTGWIQNTGEDRRFMATAEPFNLGPGESNQVISAFVFGKGQDNLTAVTRMRLVDVIAQKVFDQNFKVASPPPLPAITITETSENKIDITLDLLANGTSNYVEIDAFFETYRFNSIRILEFNNRDHLEELADGSVGHKVLYTLDKADTLGTLYDYDGDKIVPVHKKSDIQVDSTQRYIRLTLNGSAFESGAFKPGNEYYFAIQTSGYNETKLQEFKGYGTLEDGDLTKVIFSPVGAGAYSYTMGQAKNGLIRSDEPLPFTNKTGTAPDGAFLVEVIDPSKVTGDDYSVTFFSDTTDAGKLKWVLTNTTDQKVLLDSMGTYYSSDLERYDYPVVDGFMILPKALPQGLDRATSTGSMLYDNYSHEYPTWPGELGLDPVTDNYEFRHDTTTKSTEKILVTITEGTTTDTLFNDFAYLDSDGNPQLEIVRHSSYTTSLGFFGLRTVGWTVWNTTKNRRVWTMSGYGTGSHVSILLDDVNEPANIFDPNKLNGYHTNSAIRNTSTNSRNYGDYPSSSAPGLALRGIGRYDWVFRLNEPKFSATPQKVNFLKVFTSGSSYTFTTNGVNNVFDINDKKARFANVNIVPNPYLGVHAGEVSRNSAFQRIRNVGPNTTVNIFTVDGQHVRTLRKTDNNNTWLDWNLENKGRLTVAAGLYIMHIKEEGVGEKVLKSFVIPRSKKVTKR